MMLASVVGVLLENFVQLRIPGHPTTKMTLIVVVEDVVCPGASTPDHMYHQCMGIDNKCNSYYHDIVITLTLSFLSLCVVNHLV